MRIGLYYYSGAGNTKFIAKALAKKLKVLDHEVLMLRITDKHAQTFEQNVDLFIVGFPVYDLSAPSSVRTLVNNLQISTKPIAFFCTKAFASADAIRELSLVAISKNMTTVGRKEFYMPGTDLLGMFAKKGSKTETIAKFFHSRHIGKKLDRFIHKIEQQKRQRIARKWYVYLSPLIPKKWKQSFHDQYSRFVPQFFSQPDICIECMKCVKECPRDNIRFDEVIKFDLNCDMCLHCLHHCLVDSIQVGDFTKGTVRYTKVDIPL